MMDILLRTVAVLVVLVVAAMAYVRLAPTDVDRWHWLDQVDTPGDVAAPGGFLAVRRITADPEEVLATLESVALAAPRTRLIAGSVADGIMTFQTRSLVWGFPDHTTVAVQGDLLVIHGRLRFGGSDMGVNRARVTDWLGQLGPLTAAH
jgi:hypothetical protein